MARKYDDLDEMLVPQDHSQELEDVVEVGPKQKEAQNKKKAKKASKELPYQRQKVEKQKKQQIRTIVIVAISFAVLVAGLIGIGIWMGYRAGVETDTYKKAEPAEGRTFFNSDIKPELSAEGVKGRLKEVYYTKDGGLGVTLSLSNGTASRHQLVSVGIRIFNDADETIAEYDVTEFKRSCEIAAGGYNEVYFTIDKDHVYIKDDALSSLGTTLRIGSKAVGASKEPVATGPKDIAPNRTYYDYPGGIPELSAEGVKASIIKAQYTNDGSLAVTLSVSNGTPQDQQVTMVDLLMQNAAGETIADYTFESFDEPTTVLTNAYAQMTVIVDTAYVPLKDDPLNTLTNTVSVSASPIVTADAAVEQTAE